MSLLTSPDTFDIFNDIVEVEEKIEPYQPPQMAGMDPYMAQMMAAYGGGMM